MRRNETDTGAGSRCNGTALRRATRRVSQLYDAVLAPSGLRSTQRSILAHIARAGSPSMGELATMLVLDRSALAHNLKPLDRDGLIAITVDPRDRRSRLVTLTGAGLQRLTASAALWQEAQRRFEEAFGADDAKVLRATLDRIAALNFGDADCGEGDGTGRRETGQ
ncbi:MAG: winged helix-turn-helix transcriptional regulator [Telmatospirillum sp.]|nr:winged helix-turn-helix transcriptional regulator [Telmatospirillum sp.]